MKSKSFHKSLKLNISVHSHLYSDGFPDRRQGRTEDGYPVTSK